MTSVDGSAFANQLFYFSNPNIQTFDDREFVDPGNSQYAPISHAIAAQAYLDPEFRQSNISGFQYQRDQSTKDIAVYKHMGKTQRDKRVVIGYSGTRPTTDAHHLRADAALTVGTFHKTKIAKDAMKNFDKVRGANPRSTLHLAGHSLGSHTTAYIHHRHPTAVSSSIGYNVPGSIPGVASAAIRPFFETRAQKLVQKNRAEFTNNLDPVSLLNFRRGRKKNKDFTWGVHDLSQWKPRYKY